MFQIRRGRQRAAEICNIGLIMIQFRLTFLLRVVGSEMMLAANLTHRSEGFKTLHFFVGSAALKSDRISNSQDGQDLLIAHIHNNKRNGFFIDLASNDATFISNTFLLERKYDWDGICIEANPIYFWKLAHRRCTVVAAVISDTVDATAKFAFDPRSPVFGGIAGQVGDQTLNNGWQNARQLPKGVSLTQYRATTLELVLQQLHAPPVIDYMSLDIEGSEYVALKHFPFGRYTFLTMTVERPGSELRTLLNSNGYFIVWCLTKYVDVLYAHQTTLNTPMEARIRDALARRLHKSCAMNSIKESDIDSSFFYPGVKRNP